MNSHTTSSPAPLPSRLIALAAILGFGGLVACTAEQVAEVIATGTITVSVSVEGNGAGRITVDISQLVGLACRYMAGDPSVLQGSTCNESFDDGGNAGSFTLTATPDAGMVFDRWTSGCSNSTDAACTVSFPGGTNQSISIRAKFDDPNYVPLNVTPTEALIREFGAVGAVSVTAAGGLVGGTPS